MNKSILSASDFHYHDDSRISTALNFRSLVETLKPDILVIGEVFDPWKSPWAKILQTETHRIMEDMCKRRWLDRKETIYIRGNHDWSAKPDYLHYTELVTRYYYEDILFMHSWEFYIDWFLIHPFAFWIADHKPEWMCPIYNCLYGRRKSPRELKKHDTRADWTKQIGWAHLKVQDYAIKHRVRMVVQHSHCPTPFNGIFADDGDWFDSFSYILVGKQGKIELKYL